MKIKINAPFQSHTRVTDCPGSPPVIRVKQNTTSSIELPIYENKSIKRNRTVFAEQLGAYSSKRGVDRRYVLIVGPRGRVGQRRGDWLVAPAPAPSRGEPCHRGVVGNQHGRWIRTDI